MKKLLALFGVEVEVFEGPVAMLLWMAKAEERARKEQAQVLTCAACGK